jgi:hypothetical protein
MITMQPNALGMRYKTCQMIDCDAIGPGFDEHDSPRATTDPINSICKGCEELAEMSYPHLWLFSDYTTWPNALGMRSKLVK